jgi:ubiquinone/menaquinone biosynthesis C-methylase UbiE
VAEHRNFVWREATRLLHSRLTEEGAKYVGFYQNRIVPHLVNWAMRNRQLQPYRERVISTATGRVLEVGIGSGLNLALYPQEVREIVGLEPAHRLIGMARQTAERAGMKVPLIEGSAESIPLDRNSIDTVVTTWTLCTIPDPVGALMEMRRVLRPGGQLLFVEHGLAPEEKIRRWQRRLDPVWKRFAGGCHLDRPIRELIEKAGFQMAELDMAYAEGRRLMTFFYRGRAVAK